MSQKTVSITFFSNRFDKYFFFTEKSIIYLYKMFEILT